MYDPRALDNEAARAALAERVLGELGWRAARRTAVGELVRATARTMRRRTDTDTAVLLDADLAVLGSEPAAYQAYVTGVRAEYAHVDADGVARRAGGGAARAARTSAAVRDGAGRARWGARAAANMTAELVALQPPSAPTPPPRR